MNGAVAMSETTGIVSSTGDAAENALEDAAFASITQRPTSRTLTKPALVTEQAELVVLE